MALPSGLSQIGDIGAIQSLLGNNVVDASPTIDVPFTSIIGRAKILNPLKDLKARMGVERITTHSLIAMPDEFTATGEQVWGVQNDINGLVRFAGNGWYNNTSINGTMISNASATSNNAFIEVTFFGTGLNILLATGVGGGDLRASIDGGAEGTNLIIPTISTLMNGRVASENIVIQVATGLTQGVHTVKIRAAVSNVFSYDVNGVEIVNASANIVTTPGSGFVAGSRSSLATLSSIAYNANVTGTRGGRVIHYLTPNGTIAQAFRPVNASAAFYLAADHTNEEISRSYYPGEFGAGITTDWAFGNAINGPRVGVLEDGTTSLVGTSSEVGPFPANNRYGAYFEVNQSITFVFVGTGLDLEFSIGPTEASTYGIIVDGVSIGNLAYSGAPIAGQALTRTYKIASGLPYGTHTMRITSSGATPSQITMNRMHIYQPKKPVVPVGSFEIADYNVMATFVPNTTQSTLAIGTGVLRKAALREFTYVNGTGGSGDWRYLPASGVANYTSGYAAATSRPTAYFEYTFFGTGFEFRGQTYAGASNSVSVSVNGLAATSANFAGATYTTNGTNMTYGGGSGTNAALPATNTLNLLWAGGTSEASFAISGLPLGHHKVRFTNNTTSELLMSSFDLITPIHATRTNSHFTFQNTGAIGSQGLNTVRILPSEVNNKAVSQSFGTIVGQNTIYVGMIHMGDSTTTINLRKAGQVDISAHISSTCNASTNIQYGLYVDGIIVSPNAGPGVVANQISHFSIGARVPLGPGVHTVQVFWYTASGTLTTLDTRRTLTAREV